MINSSLSTDRAVARQDPPGMFSPDGRVEKRVVKSRFMGTVLVSGAAAAIIGLIGLIARALPEFGSLTHTPWLSVLLYPEAAFAFLLLGIGLLLYARYPTESLPHAGISVLAGLTVFLTLLDLRAWTTGIQPPIHGFFLKFLQTGHAPYIPSEWIAVSLLGLSGCILLLPLTGIAKHRRVIDMAGYVCSFLLLANTAVLLSYLYGTPLFQESTWNLPSLTSTLESVLLCVGTIAALGPRQIPLRPMVGRSVRARLLRTFLPVAAAAVLIHSILQDTAFSQMNPIISVTLSAFIAMAIAGFLVVRSAHIVSHQIERAVRESEERFGILVESLEDYAIFMLDPEGHVVSWNAGAQRMIGHPV